MSQSIEAVEDEWESREQLSAQLCDDRPFRERGCEGRAAELPPEQRCCHVGHAEKVKGSGHHDASEAIEHGGIPCDLRLVDGKMRGHGSVQALAGKDLQALIARDLRSGVMGDGGRPGLQCQRRSRPAETASTEFFRVRIRRLKIKRTVSG